MTAYAQQQDGLSPSLAQPLRRIGLNSDDVPGVFSTG